MWAWSTWLRCHLLRACIGLGCWLPAGLAVAQPKVLLLTPAGDSARPGFVQALQIQLARDASLETGVTLAEGKLAGRVRSATQLASQHHALLAVWVEASPATDTSHDLLLYVVGERDGRALVEVLRLQSAADPSADRSLALKVREVLDTLGRADHSWSQPFAPALLPADSAAPVGLLIHVGALAVPTRGTADLPWGLYASAGPELRLRQARFAVLAAVRWLPSYAANSGGASVALAELEPGLDLGAAHELGRLLLGVWVSPSLRSVFAEGRTPLGLRGFRTDVSAAVLGRFTAELRFTPWLSALFGLGAELLPGPRRYAVNGQRILDTGSMRAAGSFALVLRP